MNRRITRIIDIMTKRRDFIKSSLIGTAGITIGKMGLGLAPKTYQDIGTANQQSEKKNKSSGTYTLLTTCPPYGSQNVGDKLIEERIKALVRHAKGPVDFLTIFREEDLEPYLDEINKTRAVLLSAFPIRDTPMYPKVYRLVDDLSKIKVPMIPIGANWNLYPGDSESRRTLKYSKETTQFLQYICGKVDKVSCREYFACDILSNHGITNTVMTGDPVWFNLSHIGREMKRPDKVKKVVFSPPLSPYYLDQAKQVMDMLTGLFPDADRFCAFHLFDADTSATSKTENSAALSPEVTAKNRAIRSYAKELGFQIYEMAGEVKNLEFYETCDLHVGYECHAHLDFFSRRIPSVLIAEDARGVGFNYTLNVGGFDGFLRTQYDRTLGKKKVTSGYCTSVEELVIAPPRIDVIKEIREFLQHEMDSGFRRYIGLPAYLDDVFHGTMEPFIKALP